MVGLERYRGRRERWSAVRDALVGRIEAGSLRPGARLEPEPELAASLGVSRATLREALRAMEGDGFITRTRGAGTYVTRRPKVRNNLDSNFGVTDLIQSMGMRPSTEGLMIFDSTATDDEALQLGLAPGARVKVVERVRRADERPVVFSRDVLAERTIGAKGDALVALRDGSIYAWLERELGVIVAQGVASIHPLAAPTWLANQLRVPPRTQILYLRQLDLDAAGMPVVLSHEYHVAEAFEITVLRRGPGSSG